MGSLVPRTALAGRSRSLHDELAKGLGYFSIGLGIAELVMPDTICRAAGIDGQEAVVRAYGAREIATGVAILASHDPTPWIWGRVAGDALDIATVAAVPSDRPAQNDRKLWSMLALFGVTALDAFCAACLSSEKGGPRSARADYSDRSGFPKGVHAARGAGRAFDESRDTRGSEALWQHAPERTSRASGSLSSSAASGGAGEV